MMAANVDRTRQETLIVVSTIMTALGMISLTLRIFSRFSVMRKMGADDWMMLIGLTFTIIFLVQILWGLRVGIGLRIVDITASDMVELLKLVLTLQLTYNTVITAVKISILCFYLRLVTAEQTLRRIVWSSIVILVLFYVQSQVIAVFQCTPIEKIWDITGQVEGHCINVGIYFYFVAIFNIVADIWVLVLPIPTLMSIRRPTRDKVVLFIIFSMGSLSCISSIIRLYTIHVFTNSKDKFFDGVPINIWSMVEINVAIICASVPAMKPLFTGFRKRSKLGSKQTQHTFGSGHHHHMKRLGKGAESALGDHYAARAAAKHHGTGSQEIIIPSTWQIEMHREFSVEETYVDTGKGAMAFVRPVN